MQKPIPALFMRGGTSRGPFFLESDLPSDESLRNKVLLATMGSPDKRQIDGLGGAHPLTSKVGILRASTSPEVDVEFLFAQLQPDSDVVETKANCGNMLAAVVPAAIEMGLIEPKADETTVRVLTRNTGMLCDITVQTPVTEQGRRVIYDGDARIDGVPGTSAPVTINFLDTAGSICSGLLPTGNVVDTITVQPGPNDDFDSFSLDVTCIDNGMPLVIFKAADLGCTAYETTAELNANNKLKAKLEALRLQISKVMGLGDVSARNYPKMTLVSEPKSGGSINTRCFIPHVCHEAIGVLAAVTVGTACVLEGSVANKLATLPKGERKAVSIEHPSGEFTVELELAKDDPQKVTRAALLRTARLIMRGDVMIPGKVFATE